MASNLRRGLLGILFAGGLLALGCTAANASETTTGHDPSASVLTAAVDGALGTGILGGSAQGNTTDLAAAAVVDLRLGNLGVTDGDIADANVAADPGSGNPGTENPDNGTGGNGTVDPGTGGTGTVDPGTGGNSGTDDGGTDGNGTSDGATVTGTSGNRGTFIAAAGSTTVGGVIGTDSSYRSTTTANGSALANTGIDISLVPFALLLLGAGLLLLRKRRIS